MGLEKEVVKHKQEACHGWTLAVHAFSDLTNVSPVVFLYLMKACYASGASLFQSFMFLLILLFSVKGDSFIV